MINVHAAGGQEMIAAAVHAANEESLSLGIDRPIVVAVTVLTSISNQSLHQKFSPKKQ